jgi:hypothetical protein
LFLMNASFAFASRPTGAEELEPARPTQTRRSAGKRCSMVATLRSSPNGPGAFGPLPDALRRTMALWSSRPATPGACFRSRGR